ncbi:MAG: ABC transporter ATP-binding protein [Mariprofundaceae bacterium]|nr:ABC transporter ATP-binding protein [Mariprofundaceae bacterium]
MSGEILASNLHLQRGNRELLGGLSFSVQAGEITVILGPNGAGKSSLLLALAGLIPAAGKLLLNGTSLAAYKRGELARQIAWQGELPPTEFGLTVRQRLELSAGEAADAIESAAETMDIVPLLQRPLGELSSGELQRVELAAVMLREVPVWLLDEPTAHLDLRHQAHCLKMMKNQAAAGRAIVTVLHDLQQAAAVADFIILIDGKGHAERGSADRMLTIDRLSNLFDMPLIGQGKLLIPDYGPDYGDGV